MSLRDRPIELAATLPDGRQVLVRVGVPDDPYVPKRDLDTVFAELFERDRPLASVATLLGHDDVRPARDLAHEIASGLEAGTLEPTAAALEPLAERSRA